MIHRARELATRSPFVLIVLLASYVGSWAQQKPSSAPVVLKGATLIDGSGRSPIPDSVIVIEGNTFKAVGGKETIYPNNATVVDVSGKFVLPGLVDSHVHYQPWLGEMFLNHGVTTVMVPGGPDYSVAEREASYLPDTRSPRIYSTAGRLSISPSATREQVREMVRNWLKKQPDYAASLPQYNARNRQVYQWIVEDVHEAGLMVFGHTEDAPASVKVGQDSVEHLWGFAEALMTPEELKKFQNGDFLHWGTFLKDSSRIDQMIKDAVGRKAYLNPTLVYELGSQSSLAHKHELEIYDLYRDSALMTYYPQDLAGQLLLKARSVRNFSTRFENLVPLARLNAKDLQEFKNAYRLAGDFVNKWVQAGGKIMGGTDDPQVGTSGLSIHMEMAMLVELGLTPMQALQAETSWGAEMLTAGRKVPTEIPVGRIGEGAFADLVVLSANPLENIDNTRKIERVMKGGKFMRLGYTPYYKETKPGEIAAIPNIPEPEISQISPHVVVEGIPGFEMLIDGVGFVPNSVVRVDNVSVPTSFVDIRTLKATIPAEVVAKALPNRFIQPGPEQRVNVYGDRTIKITVFTGPPGGGMSNSVSLRVTGK